MHKVELTNNMNVILNIIMIDESLEKRYATMLF